MRIRTIKTMQERDGNVFVAFESALGAATARWASRSCSPEMGKEYDVELDLDVVLDREANTRDADVSVPGLFVEGTCVVLLANVESVEDDGLACLRLAQDCLIMVETAGGISVGDAIRVSVPFGSLSVTVTGSV